jgi:MFS family permease
VLLILRVALGLAIGAEYAVGQTMLAELAPAKDGDDDFRAYRRRGTADSCWP